MLRVPSDNETKIVEVNNAIEEIKIEKPAEYGEYDKNKNTLKYIEQRRLANRYNILDLLKKEIVNNSMIVR